MQYKGAAFLRGGIVTAAQDHETGLVAFVVRAKRERIEMFIASKKNRHKFVDDLWHFRRRSLSSRLHTTPLRRCSPS